MVQIVHIFCAVSEVHRKEMEMEMNRHPSQPDVEGNPVNWTGLETVWPLS